MGKRSAQLSMFIFFAITLIAPFVLAEDVPLITKEQLVAMLGKPDLVILDVRLGSDYFSSDLKIKRSVRLNMGGPICGTALVYPKSNTFVIYCASANEERSIINAKHLIETHQEDGFTKNNVLVLKGGWEQWLKANLPTENK
jgi:rhodanese-related sulfurtransferase